MTEIVSSPLRIRSSENRVALSHVLSMVEQGSVEKVVLSRSRTLDDEGGAPVVVEVLERLRRDRPGCHTFWIRGGETDFIGSTPELLVDKRADRIETQAIAGTARRGVDEAEDRELARRLADSGKDRREQQAVTRAIGEILEPLTAELELSDRPEIMSLPEAFHLHTPIRGRLRVPTSALEIAGMLHPTPAVCGLPRSVALDLLAREESERGWYTGAVGWLGAGGDGAFAVALRAALVDGPRTTLWAPDRAARIIGALGEESIRRVVPLLSPSRASALLRRLDDAQRDRCLAALDEALAGELRELATYPSDTAGALMDPRVTSFRAEATAREVIQRLRRFRNRRIQDVFVVSDDGILEGAVALQEVVLADPAAKLGTLADRSAPSVEAVASREVVLETFATHRVGSLPVVDFEGRLMGVLRQRQLVQAAEERAAAQALSMVGVSRDERAMSSAAFAVRKRLPWLQINLLTAFLAAGVVGLFEETIAKVTALAVLLPVVAGQSGNTGAQALAVTMRGLALREIRPRHWPQVAMKEVLAGAGNGIAVALTTAAAVYVWSRSTGLTLVIGVSMVLSMVIAGLAGASIPMILTLLRQDPAQSSSIVLTTVTDVAGFLSFLGIATLMSSML